MTCLWHIFRIAFVTWVLFHLSFLCAGTEVNSSRFEVVADLEPGKLPAQSLNPHTDKSRTGQLGKCSKCHGRINAVKSPQAKRQSATPTHKSTERDKKQLTVAPGNRPVESASQNLNIKCGKSKPEKHSGMRGTAPAVQTIINDHLARDVEALSKLSSGQWYEIQGSALKDLDPCPQRNCSYSGVSGQRDVTKAWGGAAYDTNNERMMVWGGGHAGYGGNEVYAFDMNTLSWSRLTDPSSVTDDSPAYLADGNPTSRHTYDTLEFVPELNAMCSFGLGSRWKNGRFGKESDCFDVGTNTWFRLDKPALQAGWGQKSAYDPTSGLVYHHGGGKSGLNVFDPVKKEWIASYYNGDRWVKDNATMAFDFRRKLLLSVGAGQFLVWETGREFYLPQGYTTSGAAEIVSGGAPGLEYDPQADRFVAWAGGATVYTLNMDTMVWATVALKNNVTPPEFAGEGGAFSKFRYAPGKNLYIAIPSGNQHNVFLFKLTNCPGTKPYT